MTPRTDHSTRLPGAFRALADPTRLKIMLMLEGKRRTVGEIVDFFALSQPTISRHLQALAAAGLVKRQKVGARVYYALNPDRLGMVCVELAACFPCCCVTVTKPEKRPGKTETEGSTPKTPESAE
jgi:DNA-binding transcriptional ArsR family regulator